jgi:hypothetical protein
LELLKVNGILLIPFLPRSKLCPRENRDGERQTKIIEQNHRSMGSETGCVELIVLKRKKEN